MDAEVSEQVNLRLRSDVIRMIDGIVRAGSFTNRQEFIREAIRDALAKMKGLPA